MSRATEMLFHQMEPEECREVCEYHAQKEDTDTLWEVVTDCFRAARDGLRFERNDFIQMMVVRNELVERGAATMH